MDSNKSPSLLQTFYDIASPDTGKVYNTIPNLIHLLQTNQKNFEEVSRKIGALPISNNTGNNGSTTLVSSSGNKSASTVAGTSAGTHSTYCNDILYTLKRLLRGLSSTNARLGFTLALIELLINFPGLSTEEVLHHLYAETNAAGMGGGKEGSKKDNVTMNGKDIKGGSSKNEIREALLGRLFGIIALYKADRFVNTNGNSTDTTNSTNSIDVYYQLLGKIINELFLISNKRSWLHPVSWEIIASLFPSTGSTLPPGHSSNSTSSSLSTSTNESNNNNFTTIVTYTLWQRSLGKIIEAQYNMNKNNSSSPPSIPPKNTKNNNNNKNTASASTTTLLPVSEWSAEHLALALAIDNAFIHWGASYTASSDKIIVPEFIRKLRTILTNSALPLNNPHPFTHAAIDSVTTYPAVHPMWRRLLDRCVSYPGQKNDSSMNTVELALWWPRLIDQTLFHNTKDRRAMAVQIFTLAVSILGKNTDALAILITPTILQLFITELPDKKRLLHGTSKEAITTVVENCRKYPNTAIVVLKAILYHGYTSFDSSTHTQTVSTLLTLIQPTEVLQYVVYLLTVFHNPNNFIHHNTDDEGTTNTKSNDVSMDETGVDFSVADIARTSGMDIDDNEDTNESKISTIDRTRLQIVMSLSYAIRNPSLTILRDMKIIKPLLAFFAYHSFITIDSKNGTNPLPKDCIHTLATEFQWNNLLEQEPIISTTISSSNSNISSNLSTLFYTVSSIQDNTRTELRTRLNTLIKEIVHVQVSEPRNTNNTEETVTSVTSTVNNSNTNTSNRERSIQTTSLSFTLLDIMNNVYDKLAQLTSTVASLTINPSPNLLTEKGEDDRHMSDDDDDEEDKDSDDDDDDDDHEHDNTVLSPLEARKLALSTANALQTISTNLGYFVSNKSIDSSLLSRIQDSSRQCSAYSSLLGQVSLAVLFDTKTMHELTSATVDLLVCCRGLLSSTFGTIYELNTLWGTDTKKANNKKDKVSNQTKTGDNDNGKYVQSLTSAVRGIQETIAAVIARTNADDEDDEETTNDSESSKQKRQYNQDMSVFIDALLALLANANASLRDTVKTAARPVLMDVTAAALKPIVELLSSDLSGNGKENSNENDDDDNENGNNLDDDEESVTLSMDSDDELSTLLGVSGNKKTKNKKRKRSFTAAMNRPSKEESEDEEEDDEASSSDGENDESVPLEARRVAALAEMEQYDRMLSHMLKLRKEARGNAKEARVRGLHFRFRALDLLDLAVSNLVTTSTYSTSSTLLQGYASPEGTKLLQLLFDCATKLASRIRSKESTGHTADAEDINTLLQRVIAIMGRLTKAKVPAMVDGLSVNDTSSVVQLYRDAEITTEFLTNFLTNVVTTVHTTRSTLLMEISSSITGCLFRLLRPVSTSSTVENTSNNNNTVAHAQNMQPSITVIPLVVSLLQQNLESYLKDKHPRISLSFYKNIFTSLPVMAIYCLETFALSIIKGYISKPFRITETLQTMTIILKLCTTTVNGNLVCEEKVHSSSTNKEKKNKKNSTIVSTGTGSTATLTVAEKLVTLLPLIYQSLTLIIQQSIQINYPSSTVTAASTSFSSTDPNNVVTLHPKQLREPLELVRLLQKAELLTNTISGAKELFLAVRNLYTVTTIDYIKKLCQNILDNANIALPEDNEVNMETSNTVTNDTETDNNNKNNSNTGKSSKAKKSKVNN